MNKIALAALVLFTFTFAVQAENIVDLQTLATRLADREQALIKKENELNDKEKRLKALEDELVAKEQELNTIKNTITQRLDEVKKNEDQNLTDLARIYAATKPKAAAEIFVKMETGTAVQIIRRIPPMSAGKIMAALGTLDADKASKISQELVPEKVNLGQ